ncbi:hypothetical protein D187_005232 [Cystobacter fuscus DSM 2262]|uniref:Type VI secretion system spike protein VgrG3-like C-terminal domain-containing protein n=1 Tax=Cystobacter fuscus (strain ATCC 25194 / DSM 2262 / NBRC 100088 / M29) TaxID=1242864 RepID=S9QS78_CYSF2|nr:hypothetical protein [Cystobacter fuscus]EPX64099.1 hypothetical protein D187_005232 [Cystobacter fuscus DSM 2262]
MDQELKKLGRLSEKYETPYPGPKGAGVVSTGKGDAGGVSYGSYQIATKTGTAAAFVQWLETHYPDMFDELAGHEPGTPGFSAAWKVLAESDAERFFEAQHVFIGETHYTPARKGVEEKLKLSLSGRSLAVKDALWSCAVQHGPRGAYDRLWRAALAGKEPSSLDDASLLQAVYAERGRRDENGNLVYFSKCSAAVQRGVAQRFANELREALERLGQEKAPNA